MKWRFVEPQDYEWAIAASKEHHKESDWSEVEYNDVKAKRYFDVAITDPNYFAILIEKGNKRIGFMAGRIMEYSYSYETFAKELELYVDPKHRNGMAGIFMMKKFMDWAKVRGGREVIFEPRLSDVAIKKFDALAKRLGMEHFANAYRRRFV